MIPTAGVHGIPTNNRRSRLGIVWDDRGNACSVYQKVDEIVKIVMVKDEYPSSTVSRSPKAVRGIHKLFLYLVK